MRGFRRNTHPSPMFAALLAGSVPTAAALAAPPAFYETSDLVDPTPQANGYYGFAVAIDNGIALVGDPRGSTPDGFTTGVVEVFDVSDPASPVSLAEFTDTNTAEPYAFPYQLDFDWPLAAVATLDGGPTAPDGRRAGAVLVFDLTDPTAPSRLSVLTPPPGLLTDIGFGYDVAIDGSLVAVSGFGDYSTSTPGDTLVGIVYLYDAASGALLTIIESDDASDSGGFVGDLALDGGFLAVGAPDGGRGGLIHLYDVSDPVAPLLLDIIDGEQLGARSIGFAIDLEGDHLITGDPNWQPDFDTRGLGRVFTFDLSDPSNPSLLAELTQVQPREFDRFGFGVALDGATAVVCCAEEPLLGIGGPTAETAYVYDLAAVDPERPLMRIRSGQGAAELASSLITPLRVANGTAISTADGDAAVVFDVSVPPCSEADLSSPRGTLDLADISEFVRLFSGSDRIADLDNSGVFDLADIVEFVSRFAAGCTD